MRTLLVIAAVFLFAGVLKTLLVIVVVWLAVAFVVGVAVGKLLARRSAEYPKPYLYDQDVERKER